MSRHGNFTGPTRPSLDDTVVFPRVPAQRDARRTQVPPVVPAVKGQPSDRRPRWTSTVTALGRAPEVLAVSALGVVIVAYGYAAGRSGSNWATAAYWIGQAVVFCPVVVRMLHRQLAGTAEALTLVLGLAINQYLLKWTYSPDQLRFPDELQHWTGTEILVRTGSLFQPNPALPVATHFPGLEETGAAVAAMSGLPTATAALVVAGVAHVAFVGLLFAVVRRASGSAALAGMTCLLYATALHYLFFDSMYVYQTGALPLLMLAVWAAVSWQQQRSGSRSLSYPLLGVVAIAAVTVTHHVTAVITAAALVLMAVCDVVFARPRRRRVLALALAAVLIVGAWFGLVARDAFSYLAPPARGLLTAAHHLLTGTGPASAGSPPGGPVWELAVQALGLVALFAVFIIALPATVRSHTHRAWRWAMLFGAAAFFATTGARFLGSQGPEIAGRASTFTYLPVAVMTATVLLERRRTAAARSRRHTTPRRRSFDRYATVGLALATLLMVGARVGGWPPRYERLPGGYLVSAFERSVDLTSVSAARWTRAWLGRGHRFAGDINGENLVSTYGEQVPVRDVAPLYYDPQWGLRDQNLQKQLGVDFVWVDLRLSQQLPASGSYFAPDPQANQHASPIPVARLAKFAQVVGVTRVYDNGTIQIYDMGNT